MITKTAISTSAILNYLKDGYTLKPVRDLYRQVGAGRARSAYRNALRNRGALGENQAALEKYLAARGRMAQPRVNPLKALGQVGAAYGLAGAGLGAGAAGINAYMNSGAVDAD